MLLGESCLSHEEVVRRGEGGREVLSEVESRRRGVGKDGVLCLVNRYREELRRGLQQEVQPRVLQQQGDEDAGLFGYRTGVGVFAWRIALGGCMSGTGRVRKNRRDGEAALDNGLLEEPFKDDVMDGAGLFSLGEMEESDNEAADARFVLEQPDDEWGLRTNITSRARALVA